MDWKYVERLGRIELQSPDFSEGDAQGIKSGKRHNKFCFLVPRFLQCYNWIRPKEGDYVIYKGGKKIQKEYPITPLVTALMVRFFNNYYWDKKISNRDLFLMQGFAFYENSFYHKKRESEHPGFFRGETPPEIFNLSISDKSTEHFNDISLKKYTKYITKSFFRKCLIKVFEGFENTYGNLAPTGYGYDISQEDMAILDFFVIGATNFFSSLDLGNEYYNMMDDEENNRLYEKSRPITRIQRAIKLHLNGFYDEEYVDDSNEFGDGLITPSVEVAWNYLYERNGERIDRRIDFLEDGDLEYIVE